ncbi:hypothetical protein L2E82_31779 [Cichorium intybus]|uniref:Uncharacterized protein n=1 Tax=Cichorium intybus TaxID=13427 RepID=A0ACB9BF03_CICIN|nr:hypothetical protein L2E82_31779 [Cichorium intybus]
MRLLKVATCNLNQWTMEFDCNLKSIKESIIRAKEAGAVIRLGLELEITVSHAWECLKDLLLGDWTDGILCSFGMPVIKGSQRYNYQVLCMNRKIIMIREKMWLANDGNYRELRWFTAWKQKDKLEEFQLPSDISNALSQRTVPFGYGFMQFLDTAVAAEIFEELFAPIPPHSELALNGVEVFMNASGSHHQLRKLDIHGYACVVVNGDVVAQCSQFSLKDVEVMVASLRGSISSFQEQASCKRFVSFVDVPYKLCQPFNLQMSLSSPLKITYHSPEEEIAFGPGCWLWDYLRRSGASGFLLPLFGGADSSSVAGIVGCMYQLVVKVIENSLLTARNLQNVYFKRFLWDLKTGNSDATRSWAKLLSEDTVVYAFLSLFQTLTGKRPRYKYDCSSADINPIGSISKQYIRIFLRWAATHLAFSSLAEIEAAPPTAELEPIRSNYSQLDEVDMGMTYEELSVYGRLRKIFRCGPVSMFKNPCFGWGLKLSPSEVAEKVKHFFKYYSINRHKMTVLTGSVVYFKKREVPTCSKKGSGKGFHPGKASRPGGRRPMKYYLILEMPSNQLIPQTESIGGRVLPFFKACIRISQPSKKDVHN